MKGEVVQHSICEIRSLQHLLFQSSNAKGGAAGPITCLTDTKPLRGLALKPAEPNPAGCVTGLLES